MPTWTPELDRKMLLLVIKGAGIKINNGQIATLMSNEDETFTPKAIENRMGRLKTMVKSADEGGAAVVGSKDNEPSPKPKAKGRKRAVAADDEDEGEPVPKKKVRKAAPKAKGGKGRKPVFDAEEPEEDA